VQEKRKYQFYDLRIGPFLEVSTSLIIEAVNPKKKYYKYQYLPLSNFLNYTLKYLEFFLIPNYNNRKKERTLSVIF
jgi:hypothetical protein